MTIKVDETTRKINEIVWKAMNNQGNSKKIGRNTRNNNEMAIERNDIAITSMKQRQESKVRQDKPMKSQREAIKNDEKAKKNNGTAMKFNELFGKIS